jgi:uncharacterized protein YlzI (FlbEa/FlbD family)
MYRSGMENGMLFLINDGMIEIINTTDDTLFKLYPTTIPN